MLALKVLASSPDGMNVNPAIGNGGYPLPAAGVAMRVIASRHAACGAETEIWLPAVLPADSIKLIVCESCLESYEADVRPVAEFPETLEPDTLVATVPEPEVVEVAAVAAVTPVPSASPANALSLPSVSMPSVSVPSISMPSFSMPSFSLPSLSMPALPATPQLPSMSGGGSLSMPSLNGIDRRWLTLPVAALIVFFVLGKVRGDDPAPISAEPPAAAESAPVTRAKANTQANAAGSRGGASPAIAKNAQLVSEGTFSLALPAGWDRVTPANGATFSAVSADGTAEATLWIQNDPKLDMATFESTSRAQLEGLAGSAEVVDRKTGPNIESSSVTLAPQGAPDGAPTYQVVLRGAGNNWYYLSTIYQPDAPAAAVDGVELIQGSFVPQGSAG